MYLIIGTFLIYGVVWLLGTGLALDNLSGSSTNASGNLLNNLINRVLFQILSFLKAFAFFWAIVTAARYGFKMIRAQDKDATIKEAKT